MDGIWCHCSSSFPWELKNTNKTPDGTLITFQEVTQKILEAVGTVAGSSLEQTSWLSRNLEVKAQPQILPDEFNVEDVNGNVAFLPPAAPSPLLRGL